MFGTGHELNQGNCYNSPVLSIQLQYHSTNVVGTVHSNWKYLLRDLKATHYNKDYHTTLTDVLCLSQRYKKPITMLSTIPTFQTVNLIARKEFWSKPCQDEEAYLCNQHTQYYLRPCTSIVWNRKVFFKLLNMWCHQCL